MGGGAPERPSGKRASAADPADGWVEGGPTRALPDGGRGAGTPLQKMSPRAYAPQDAPIVSATKSSSSALRPGTNAWCSSSESPKADARKAPSASIRRRGFRGQVRSVACAQKKPSTPYSTRWMSLSRIGTEGSSGSSTRNEEIVKMSAM